MTRFLGGVSLCQKYQWALPMAEQGQHKKLKLRIGLVVLQSAWPWMYRGRHPSPALGVQGVLPGGGDSLVGM